MATTGHFDYNRKSLLIRNITTSDNKVNLYLFFHCFDVNCQLGWLTVTFDHISPMWDQYTTLYIHFYFYKITGCTKMTCGGGIITTFSLILTIEYRIMCISYETRNKLFLYLHNINVTNIKWSLHLPSFYYPCNEWPVHHHPVQV